MINVNGHFYFYNEVNYSPNIFGNIAIKKEALYTLISVAKATSQATFPTG
jgi:hypothetical protein